MLRNFTKLFDGTLGVYLHRKFHIDIMPDAKPKLVRPYTIARIHLKHFKKELNHLVCIGVLSPQSPVSGDHQRSSLRRRMDAYVGSVTYVNLTR